VLSLLAIGHGTTGPGPGPAGPADPTVNRRPGDHHTSQGTGQPDGSRLSPQESAAEPPGRTAARHRRTQEALRSSPDAVFQSGPSPKLPASCAADRAGRSRRLACLRFSDRHNVVSAAAGGRDAAVQEQGLHADAEVLVVATMVQVLGLRRCGAADPGQDGRDDTVAEGEQRGDAAGGVRRDEAATGPGGLAGKAPIRGVSCARRRPAGWCSRRAASGGRPWRPIRRP
jgi:hypothetical protein